ncbi:hypothetical protein [Nocardia transvalensis]|uniref:hypothetical protein n=1 Tax=Nocardia transvalensis TaxID=37333 RepID=UPI001895BCDD|nr:hypothetical protein [Nocardia transvalensis]MBF6332100.1 hypothetical protein [Nocardia transvalensis]
MAAQEPGEQPVPQARRAPGVRAQEQAAVQEPEVPQAHLAVRAQLAVPRPGPEVQARASVTRVRPPKVQEPVRQARGAVGQRLGPVVQVRAPGLRALVPLARVLVVRRLRLVVQLRALGVQGLAPQVEVARRRAPVRQARVLVVRRLRPVV